MASAFDFTEDQMDQLVDDWHTSDSSLSLAQFLGMSWEEYGYWTQFGFEAWKSRYCS